MIDNFRNSELEKLEKEEIYSKAVRAGKRTYFFDVKATKGNDFYLTVTESKKRTEEDGSFRFEKHKIFLYKEDFEKFSDGLNDAVRVIGLLLEGKEIELEESVELELALDSSSKKLAAVNYDDL